MKCSSRAFLLFIAVWHISILAKAQENIEDFLLLGEVVATELVERYMNPLGEGLSYGLTGGWYSSARVSEPWSIDLAVVTNGSYVPSEKKQFIIDTNDFGNLTTDLGEVAVSLPTALGGGDFDEVVFIAQIENETFEFNVPAGLGLLYVNFLPSAFIQAKIGLPKYTEAGIRFFPKLDLGNELDMGIFGFGAQHEFTRWFKGLDNKPIAFSFFAAYTRLDAEYKLGQSELVTGEDQRVEFRVNTLLMEFVGSTTFKVLNFYGGIGYLAGDTRTRMAGNYEIDLETDTLVFNDPITAEGTNSGIRANLGAKLTLNWFSLNAAYTFQGFNNLSVGMHFRLR